MACRSTVMFWSGKTTWGKEVVTQSSKDVFRTATTGFKERYAILFLVCLILVPICYNRLSMLETHATARGNFLSVDGCSWRRICGVLSDSPLDGLHLARCSPFR